VPDGVLEALRVVWHVVEIPDGLAGLQVSVLHIRSSSRHLKWDPIWSALRLQIPTLLAHRLFTNKPLVRTLG
jgi:hypothetical protein